MDTKYPWIKDPVSLPHNRNAVETTFVRTERQLKRELEWHVAYAAQVHNMVLRQAAKKLTKETIAKISVWYIRHLVAPNTYFFTTPVQVVWISSQKYKGISMNDLLQKGPDVLNPIQAIPFPRSKRIGPEPQKLHSLWGSAKTHSGTCSLRPKKK